MGNIQQRLGTTFYQSCCAPDEGHGYQSPEPSPSNQPDSAYSIYSMDSSHASHLTRKSYRSFKENDDIEPTLFKPGSVHHHITPKELIESLRGFRTGNLKKQNHNVSKDSDSDEPIPASYRDSWNQDEIVDVNFEMIEMPTPPLLNIYMNDIIYYRSKKTKEDLVIGCTAYMHIMKSQYKEGIYVYNLNTCKYKFLSDIPDELCDYQAELAFDHENEELHFLFGDGKVWGKYNVSKNRWKIKSSPNDPWSNRISVMERDQYGIKAVRNCKCLIVDGIPHVVGQGMHFIFDKYSDRFVEWPLTTFGEFQPKNFVHVPLLNRLYIFGGRGINLDHHRFRLYKP